MYTSDTDRMLKAMRTKPKPGTVNVWVTDNKTIPLPYVPNPMGYMLNALKQDQLDSTGI